MKTGWRGPCVLQKNTNFQTFKLTKLTSGLCPLRAADLTGSGPHAAIACIQGFPLCQRHPPLSDDDADTKGFLGFGFKNKNALDLSGATIISGTPY
ncbi:MAG: hypothetical protein MSS51_05105 [Bacteroidales bacterium]|nr:hypothetical protein [Bacteroidales bacterium]